MLLSRADSLLLVVDIQERLAPAIHDSETVTANSVRLLEAAGQLEVPAFVSEQYVKGLGPSLAAIRKPPAPRTFSKRSTSHAPSNPASPTCCAPAGAGRLS